MQKGLNVLGSNDQKDLVIDLMETYFQEHVKKTNDTDELFYRMCEFVFQKGDEGRVEVFFDRVIE